MTTTEPPTAVGRAGKPARPATDPAGPTGRLATWVADTTLDDVPASVRDRAKHLVLDGIGCALVGAQLPWSRIGVEGVTALDDAGDSVLVGWDGKATSATSAAMVNSSFIQGFELDDYHPLAPLHSNSLVLPAMLAAAPRVGRVSGAQFLLGAILGYETGPRVGQALGGLDMLSRGWHSGVVFGPLAAAAAAGTLYGLDAAGFEDAFGMAATQSCGLMSAMFESMVKRMQHGFASRNGLTAAALAAAGYVGIKRVFERPYGGWLAVFGEGHRTYPEQIYAGLGTLWETQRIAVKPYSCMGLLHAAIDAALELRPKVDVSQIQRIDIDMGEAAYSHGGWQAERPLQVIGAQMNVAYAVAVALLDGDVLIDQFTQDRINRDDVWALIDRTVTHHAGLRQAPGRRATHHPGAPDPHRRDHPHRHGRPPARHRRPDPDQRRHPRQVRQADPPHHLRRPPGGHRENRPQPRHPRRRRSADRPAHTRRALTTRLKSTKGCLP